CQQRGNWPQLTF
nr:immunoglobulin light chain junction region [Macaca mulatta]